MVGNGADMTVRPARRDNHAVGDRAFVFQVDKNDILGLIVVKTGQYESFQPLDRGKVLVVLVGGVGRVGDILWRSLRGVAVQPGAPLALLAAKTLP